MSTPNFGRVNTSRYYAFGLEPDADYFAYEDKREELLWAMEDDKRFIAPQRWHSPKHNGFVGYYVDYVEHCGCRFEVSMEITMTSGYYAGAVFDYEHPEIDSEEFADDLDLWEEILWSQLYYKLDNPVGLCKMQARNLRRKAAAKVEEMHQALEDVFARLCEEQLVCVGIFSNGEAIYERAATLRGEVNAMAV